VTPVAVPVETRQLVAGCLLASFRGPAVPAWLRRWIADGLGGVTLFGDNIGSADAVLALTRDLHAGRDDVVVALDEEGGDVTRLEVAIGSSWPGNAALGAVGDVELTDAVARAMGAQLAAAGIDLDLAPCADVNSNPRNPVIGVRSFGSEPQLVARHVAAFVSGLQAAGVAACAKHFPGHGDTVVDSHLALPVVDVDLPTMRSRELVPFAAAVDAGVAAVMTSHLVVPALDTSPATISRRVSVNLLRDELGFGGAIVSDALDMRGISAERGIPAAAVASLTAGADLLCLGARQDEDVLVAVEAAVVAALRDGTLSEERLSEASTRRAALRRPSVTGGGSVDLDLGRRAAARAVVVDGVVPTRPMRGAHVVKCQPPDGMAQGAMPWGIAGAMAALDPAVTSGTLAAGDNAGVEATRAAGRPLVVVVRDAGRHRWQLDHLRRLYRLRPDLVTVEMGWPGPDLLPGAAVIRTFGASRVSGEAVAALLLDEDGISG
jgi:beta-N-acetylhexosaminidase